MAWSTKQITVESERVVLMGLVVSDPVAAGLDGVIKPEHFSTPQTQRIAKWCLEHWQQYHKSPGQDLKAIYLAERKSMPDEEAEWVFNFLKQLSSQYDEGKGKFNAKYAIDQGRKFAKEQGLRLLHKQLGKWLDSGRLEQAEEQVTGYNQVAKAVGRWSDPLTDKRLISEALDPDNEAAIFTFRGDVGRMIGPIERSHLVGFMAPAKRGKTWWLEDAAMEGVACGLKVALFSLEMNDQQITRRIQRYITPLPPRAGEYTFPVWDCVKNQRDFCGRAERTSGVGLIQEEENGKGKKKNGRSAHDGKPLDPRDAPDDYLPCDYCYHHGLPDYQLATWLEVRKLKALKISQAIRNSEKLIHMTRGRLRLQTWPPYTAGMADIVSTLNIWENLDGFIPDMVVIDYADILRPDRQLGEERHMLDRIWKAMKALAQERQVIVISASQTNRPSFGSERLDAQDIAEDIRKLAHVDLLLPINQTAQEKRSRVWRLGVLVQRHEEFFISDECWILNQLQVGQPYLDSRLARNLGTRRM